MHPTPSPLRGAWLAATASLAAALLAAGCSGTPRGGAGTATADAQIRPSAPYPADSLRLGEQGRVLVRVLTRADGYPLQAQVQQSSGYSRLDQAALDTVMKWRFAATAGPEDVWREVPFTFGILGQPL